MPVHEHFEELCALASIGQVSGDENAELLAHADNCAACHAALAEMHWLADEVLPLTDQPARHLFNSLRYRHEATDCRTQFLSRARADGIPLTGQADRPSAASSSWPFMAFRPYVTAVTLAACAVVVLAMAAILVTKPSPRVSEPTPSQAAMTALIRENSALRQKLAARVPEVRQGSEPQGDGGQAQLAALYSAALDRVSELERSLSSEQQRAGATEHDLEAARAENARNLTTIAADVQALNDVKAQLDNARATHTADQVALAEQQHKVNEASDQLRLQMASLDREREMLSAGRDIRDLMGARDLHIIDVHDTDPKGKRRKSFGRMFYTEGKSLIFYAFDLGSPKMNNASFQAWGQREDGRTQTVSLGVFYFDDQKTSRWALKFDNPSVLRDIDSVFVTIEPPGGRAKPTGDRFLYAYLNTEPNHP